MTKRAYGSGSIIQTPAGNWRALASVQGKRVTKTFENHKEARAWLREIIRQAEHGLGYDAARTRLDAFLQAWLETKKPGLRPASIYQYERQILNQIGPGLGNLRLREVTPARIQAFYDGMQKQGRGRRTVMLTHVVLHGALEHARRIGLLIQNPCDLVQTPRPIKREMTVWNESQVNQFLVITGGNVFYRMAFSTGMRRGELLGLKWSDLDWKTGMLQVRRQVYKGPGEAWIFQEPKTARGKRAVRIGAGLLEALRIHYTETIPLMMSVAGDVWEDYDLVFPSMKGKPMSGQVTSARFHQLVQESGLPMMRFHDIRHTCASLLLAHREPPVRVAAMLGHSIQMLLETYAHYIPDDSETAALLMDEITTPAALPDSIAFKLHTVERDRPGDIPEVGENHSI